MMAENPRSQVQFREIGAGLGLGTFPHHSD